MQQVDLAGLVLALDAICPMHVIVTRKGQITHIGRTLRKLLPPDALGRDIGDMLLIQKPFSDDQFQDISQITGLKLKMQIKEKEVPSLIGIAMPLGEHFLFNLSFGISIATSIKSLELKIGDFAVTDSAAEMLYLSEAKSAAMQEFKRLSARLTGAITRAEKEATTDALTGLLNFRALRATLTTLLATKQEFAIMMIDLDFFKEVNDTLGHAAGDQVLKEMALILKEETRKEDIVARNGGDEFTVLLKGVGDAHSVETIANRIIERIQQPISFGGAFCHVSASIGTMFFYKDSNADADALLSRADNALYQSKRTGRGKNTISSECNPL